LETSQLKNFENGGSPSRDPIEIRRKTVGKSRDVRPIQEKREARARERASESEMEKRAVMIN
jgi:hypothetical protein